MDRNVDTLRNWYGAFLAANIASDKTCILGSDFEERSGLMGRYTTRLLNASYLLAGTFGEFH